MYKSSGARLGLGHSETRKGVFEADFEITEQRMQKQDIGSEDCEYVGVMLQRMIVLITEEGYLMLCKW